MHSLLTCRCGTGLTKWISWGVPLQSAGHDRAKGTALRNCLQAGIVCHLTRRAHFPRRATGWAPASPSTDSLLMGSHYVTGAGPGPLRPHFSSSKSPMVDGSPPLENEESYQLNCFPVIPLSPSAAGASSSWEPHTKIPTAMSIHKQGPSQPRACWTR